MREASGKLACDDRWERLCQEDVESGLGEPGASILLSRVVVADPVCHLLILLTPFFLAD